MQILRRPGFAALATSAFASLATPVLAADGDVINGWIEVEPGGETRCARNTPFAFFVNPGSSDKVILDFIGGGACWDAVSCAPETATFTADLSDVREHAANLTGVYDRSRADNPYRDWTHVIVPYCTGDIHWGSSDVTYTKDDGTQFTINHRGAINARAVLAWVKERYAAARDMMVTGCSAGSYGSIYWTPHVVEAFPGARVRQFGDSGAGVLGPNFLYHSIPNWNVTNSAPSWIPALDPDLVDYRTLSLDELYVRLARHYPDTRFAQFNHVEDAVQQIYYWRMGAEDVNTWRPEMLASLSSIRERAPNFRSFIAPGDAHCATIENTFYGERSDNVSLRDWVSDYMDMRDVDSVACAECGPIP